MIPEPQEPLAPPDPPERNLLLVVAYDGTDYAGWQYQPNRPTVQGAIEARLAELTRSFARLRVAGRTDAGVHAEGQLACVRTRSRISCEGLRRGLNALLPKDISIRDVREVGLDFNPRHHNQGKHYRYTIWRARELSMLHHRRSHHLFRPLDLVAMAQAGRLLVGTHDFAAFRAADCDRPTTVRTLFRCTVNDEGPLLHLDVEGTAFLKNMVRIVAGTLVDIGAGRMPVARIEELFASGDRTRAGATLPPHGLSMVRVLLDAHASTRDEARL
ncbi:MAG: tRNA pseudouridine(38-40) synthase TruA [Deltaproteobacteria bacterium]|nr:tRNA pseudouridine(38-40) synthase TruA [Deltaproteobacteria bacterium]